METYGWCFGVRDYHAAKSTCSFDCFWSSVCRSAKHSWFSSVLSNAFTTLWIQILGHNKKRDNNGPCQFQKVFWKKICFFFIFPNVLGTTKQNPDMNQTQLVSGVNSHAWGDFLCTEAQKQAVNFGRIPKTVHSDVCQDSGNARKNLKDLPTVFCGLVDDICIYIPYMQILMHVILGLLFLMAFIHVTFKLRIRRSRLFGMSFWTYQAVKSTVATWHEKGLNGNSETFPWLKTNHIMWNLRAFGGSNKNMRLIFQAFNFRTYSIWKPKCS